MVKIISAQNYAGVDTFKGSFVGTPPAQHPFSPLLLSVQDMESCCRDRGHSTPQEVYPLYNRPRKESGTGAEGMGETTGEQSAEKRNTACCNCLSWLKSLMGSSI